MIIKDKASFCLRKQIWFPLHVRFWRKEGPIKIQVQSPIHPVIKNLNLYLTREKCSCDFNSSMIWRIIIKTGNICKPSHYGGVFFTNNKNNFQMLFENLQVLLVLSAGALMLPKSKIPLNVILFILGSISNWHVLNILNRCF